MLTIVRDVDYGSIPYAEQEEEPTAERCTTCGRGPGVVSAPGVDRFDLGIAYAYNQLYELMREFGIGAEEAASIVLRMRRHDPGV